MDYVFEDKGTFGFGAAAETINDTPRMLMAGAPIVRYDPFVMNTEDEICQALAELPSGIFASNSAT